jgi:hypothetical protein
VAATTITEAVRNDYFFLWLFFPPLRDPFLPRPPPFFLPGISISTDGIGKTGVQAKGQ